MITVANNSEAARLYAEGLRFGGTLRVVERYWEASPGSICPTCFGIGHDRLGGCVSTPIKCTICIGPHKVDGQRCGVNGCTIGTGNICTHITALFANCDGNHQASSLKCLARQKAEVEAKKGRNNHVENRTSTMSA